MPELPEVETVSRGIRPHLEGQAIQEIIIRNPNLRWRVDAQLSIKVVGQVVQKITRRSKYIVWHLEQGALLWHLGMTGVMRVLTEPELPLKHDHIDVVFANKILRFTDPRRFGALIFTEDWQKHSRIVNLGPEPLGPGFNNIYLKEKLEKTQRAIKFAIMDAHVVVGVGNIYANESLFLARIHPQRIAASLTLGEVGSLTAAVEITISKAIEFGGTTLKDFIGSDGKPGYFRNELQVYGRKDEPCFACRNPIQKIVLGGRATYFCAQCQRL